MSIVQGKGRGRGFVDARETSLRRPGQTPVKLQDLTTLFKNLTVDDLKNYKAGDIAQKITECMKNNSLTEICNDLHNHALEDRQFGTKLVIAINHSEVLSLEDGNFRKLMLNLLQNDYKEKDEIKQRSIAQFRNMVSLMGEFFYRIKIGGRNESIFILARPCLEYLEILLESSEEEDLKLASIQLFRNGKSFELICQKELENFMIHVRKVLVNKNLSARSRAKLLYMIDLAAQNFEQPSGALKEFYALEEEEEERSFILDHLKTDPDLKISECKNPKLTEKIPVAVSEHNFKISDSKIPEVTENFPVVVSNERPSGPRAIRGAGAVDNVKDGNMRKSPGGRNERFTDEDIWSSKNNTFNKGWGHDDRFEKDY